MPIRIGVLTKLGVVAAAAGVFAFGAGVGWGVSTPAAADAVATVEPPKVKDHSGYVAIDVIDRVEPKPEPKPLPRLDTWTYGVVSISPYSTERQGVGSIIRVKFDSAIPEAARWSIQENLAVKSSDPKQDLSAPWVWLDSETVAYRPKDFWRPNQTVTVASTWPVDSPVALIPKKQGKKRVAYRNLVGVTMSENVSLEVRIGSAQILTVDANTHRGVVERNGKVVKEVPVSLGKAGWETASGVKTVMERYEIKRLYNPGLWDVTAPYAMRLTVTGEFLHSASWNGSIGYANTSHGCTNVTVADAKWFYENLQRGDPVITVNGGSEPAWWDGDGAPWNIPWSTWKAMSAPVP